MAIRTKPRRVLPQEQDEDLEAFHEAEVAREPRSLECWLRYIDWAELESASLAASVCERCGRALLDEAWARNDERYVRVWLRLASGVEQPDWVFELLDERGVGAELAIFWVAWAFVAEKDERFGEADDIYARGAAARAEPVDLLDRRRREFERRMKRRFIQSTSTKCKLTSGRAPLQPLDMPATAAKPISRKLVFSTAKRHDPATTCHKLQRADDTDLTINSSIAQRAIEDLFHDQTATYDAATLLADEEPTTARDSSPPPKEGNDKGDFAIFVDE